MIAKGGDTRVLRSILLLVCIATLSPNLYAEALKSGKVSGRVLSKDTKEPIESASIILFTSRDSTMAAGGMTTSKGTFSIEQVGAERYYAVVSCIGFKSYTTSSFSLDADHATQDFGTITLEVTAINMKGMTVTTELPTQANAIDRKVYNVQNDVTAQTGSASELLQHIPSVTVDIDGTVSLRGSGNVLILINGRPSPLMDKNQADILQQLPANSIERVEVITNPSAKYKPNGTAGMINIVLKRDRHEGFGGSASANAGEGGRYNGTVSLNYNPGKVNFFGSFGLRKDHRNRKSLDSRQYYYVGPDTSSYYLEADTSTDRPVSVLAGLGIDVTPNRRDRLGISANLFHRTFTRTEALSSVTLGNQGDTATDYLRYRHDDEYQREDEATAYVEHAFNADDHTIRIEYNISNQPEHEDNHYTNFYTVPVLPPSYDNTLIRQGETQQHLTMEYANPQLAIAQFEGGFVHDQTHDDFDHYISYFDTLRQEFVTDSTKSNYFVYDQRVEALYGTLKRSLGSFGVLAGLRYEYVHNDANLVTKDTAFSTDYSDFYPSLHLSLELNKVSELQLNYSKRTNRPDGEELNPFQEYRDPLNVRAGNPLLLPEYIHSLELGWQIRSAKLTFTPSVYYRYRYNGFTSVSHIIQDSILLTTPANFANDQSGGLELVLDGSLGSVVTANASTNVFYNTIDASNTGFSSKKSVITSSGAINVNVNLRRGLVVQLNSNYQGTRLTPQGEVRPTVALNIGGKCNLVDENLSLVVTASDVLKTRRQQIEVRTVELNRDFNGTRDGRVWYVGLVYHFGQSSKKSKDKPLEYDNSN